MTFNEAKAILAIPDNIDLTQDVIKEFYRKKAHETHPDKFHNKGLVIHLTAAERFREAHSAYNFLLAYYGSLHLNGNDIDIKLEGTASSFKSEDRTEELRNQFLVAMAFCTIISQAYFNGIRNKIYTGV